MDAVILIFPKLKKKTILFGARGSQPKPEDSSLQKWGRDNLQEVGKPYVRNHGCK